MNIPNYSSEEFADKVAAHTFCGKNAWLRLMSWLDVDENFQQFLTVWTEKIAPYYHQENVSTNDLPDISGLLEEFFEELYPSQFILRLFQIASTELRTWLLTSLNKEQQEILYYWYLDSKTDHLKAKIADNWLEPYKEENIKFNNTPIFECITSEIFQTISQISNENRKRIR